MCTACTFEWIYKQYTISGSVALVSNVYLTNDHCVINEYTLCFSLYSPNHMLNVITKVKFLPIIPNRAEDTIIQLENIQIVLI